MRHATAFVIVVSAALSFVACSSSDSSSPGD
jgi:hypothetical protein